MDQDPRLAVEIDQLKRRIEELEASNRHLRDFSATAFHDLQEPLRKLGTFADLLEQALAREDRTEVAYAVDVLRRSSRQVQQLVRDVLSYSRSTRTELQRDAVSVRAVVDEVLSAVSGTVVETSAIMTVQVDPVVVCADRMQFYHLVVNLVSNSLKFYAPGTEPYVELSTMRGPEGELKLRISDRGIGFDPGERQTIFDPFRRLNARSAYQGSGLGLSICRAIVERHGWTISVDAAPGAGARFEIAIPPCDVL